jgi:hypothetical protein
MPNAANFLEGQNDFGKTIQKQCLPCRRPGTEKNEGQKHGDGVSSKSAHCGATRSCKHFSALHFSVIAFLKS